MNHLNLPSWQEVCKEFQRIWGYDNFRFPQGEIVQSLLSGQDALIIMPTGGGKSICFQLPALLKDGLTLVISPLIALMENQVQELRSLNLSAGVIHSQMPREQRQRILAAIIHNKLRLLYISPETLFNDTLWNVISQKDIRINGLIVDEAHCLVQWGETFRPAYRRLGTVRSALLKHKPPGTIIPIAAFTATADPTAQKSIIQVLELKKPECFLVNPYRDNLVLKTQTVCTAKRRRQEVLKFLKQHEGKTGLIYVRTRKDSEGLATFLQELDYQTLPYHAGLESSERRGIEQLWLNDRIKFVICTSAFGMGVNKANVRWVLHYQAPLLLSEYVQEVGRAGRDGQLATALTLVSEPTGLLDTGDRQRWRYFLN
ncbi:MAG: RecQ family ATP-dependent DNA helicase, partial [Microcoleaceae cyanobacterium]